MAETTRFPGLDPLLEDYSPSHSHSDPNNSTRSTGDLIDLSTSDRGSPVVSSVQRKPLTVEGQPSGHATSPRAKSRLNAGGSSYTPGSYSQRVKSTGGSPSYVPGSYSQQRKQRGTPTPPKPKESSDAEASATASSVVSFDMPLYSSSSEPLVAEPAVTVMEPFQLPSPEATPNLAAPSAMHVANPTATLDDPTNFDAMAALMRKLSVKGNDSQISDTGESKVIRPSLSPKEVLAAAGVDINIDKLQATQDGKAPLELVGTFLTCVMNQKYEAALILCQYVLRYESENETAREFYPLIIEKIHRESFGSESSSNSSDSSGDDDDDDDDETSEESEELDSSESDSNPDEMSSSEQEDEGVGEHMHNDSIPSSQPLQ